MNEFTRTIINGLKTYIQKSRGNWNQNDETAVDYIKNRTHYSEITETTTNVLEWDGNTKGLITLEDVICKVSDVILEPSDFINATITATLEQDGVKQQIEAVMTEREIATISENLFVIGELMVMVAKKDNIELEGVILPKAGIYFLNYPEGNARLFISKLEINNGSFPFKTITEVVHKIDKKYLPEISSIKNVLDGSAEGSVRTIYSAPEDDEYTMGESAFAEGSYTTASGAYSHAEGNSTTASGYASHAEGEGTIASGNWSHAEGGGTIASGNWSHTEGEGTMASDNWSHAEGHGTTASGAYSHAEGSYTIASGSYSHAESGYTTASGYASHAEGWNTEASGEYSHAEGYFTTASSQCQHVQGKYNIEDTENKYAHIVGNGTSSSSRSNIHTLDWDGNAWYQGDVYVGSTSGKNKDAGSKKLATIDDLSNASAAGLEDAKAYTDQELANLVGTAPEMLDTIEELATAFQQNEDIVETLNQAIGNKADKTELEAFATKEYVDTEVNKPKNYVMFVDQVNGYNYAVQMRNGNLVSRCTISTIEVTTLPDRVEYLQGEYLDTTGLVITATCYDGNTFEITDYTYTNEPLAVGENVIEISYTEFDMTYTTSFKVVTEGFNPEVTLIDFDYTTNDDGTYTLTNWKQTLNGEPSTKMVIPDYSVIRL